MFAKSAITVMSRFRAYPLALLALMLLTAVSVTWGVKARGWVKRPVKPAFQQSQAAPIQTMVLTTVSRFGFEPREMTIPEGDCQITIRDAFGSDELNFLISDLGANNGNPKPLTKHTKESKHSKKAVLRLKAGQFAITEAAHPAWQFTLNVTAK